MTWWLAFPLILWSLLPWPTLGWLPHHLPLSRNHAAKHSLTRCASSAEDGVSLAGLTSVDEDSAWFANAVVELLDDEWIPQPCHGRIGAEVGAIYKAARANGVDDLNGLVVEVGNGLSAFDMGDAFVGPWDVANALSDLTLVRLGREGCGCNVAMKTPHFTSAAVTSLVSSHLKEHFPRYKFLGSVLDSSIPWKEVSVVVALVMGYRPTGTILEGGSEEVDAGLVVSEEWRAMTSRVPPLLDAASPLVAKLELELPEEGSEGRDMLEDFVKLNHGDTLATMAWEAGDKDFASRAIVVQWLHQNDFLGMDF